MNKAKIVVVSSVLLALIGLAAGVVAIANLPPLNPTNDPSYDSTAHWVNQAEERTVTVVLLSLGSTMTGAGIGLVVGIVAALLTSPPFSSADEGTPSLPDPPA
jgi:hypothetical protein